MYSRRISWPDGIMTAMGTHDEELFARWQEEDDNRAGDELLERYIQPLYRFFHNKVDRDIDDLIAETFKRCIQGKNGFRRQASFRTFLFRIARNELYRYLERKQNHGQIDFGVTSVADMGISPTGKLKQDQRNQVLHQAMRALPVDQQLLFELFYWEEMSHAELAEVMDITEEASRARLKRARNSLRKKLEELEPAFEFDL